ncbi:hypothetical protein B9Z55_016354 [Caenorhabditis nigoni]|uniref:Uncharacterized protein n=1 Tax=Caenorhabditis nigoni TaxID=1611254 RepID=A0A2G5T4P5_9PELO|nr:hypothetical protein B9Z55_016354 [Caenorhabditis nigoni]
MNHHVFLFYYICEKWTKEEEASEREASPGELFIEPAKPPHVSLVFLPAFSVWSSVSPVFRVFAVERLFFSPGNSIQEEGTMAADRHHRSN